jgi:hypothetical protein
MSLTVVGLEASCRVEIVATALHLVVVEPAQQEAVQARAPQCDSQMGS